MKNIFIKILILILLTSCFAKKAKEGIFANNLTIKWNSEYGVKMLERSNYKQDFYELAGFFQPQINPLYCAIASSVIILNAINFDKNNISSQKKLEVRRPEIFGGGMIPFKSYSQLSLLNSKTDIIKREEVISMKNIDDKRMNIDPGVTLGQLKDILELYGTEVTKYHVKKYSKQELDFFRKKVKNITQDKDRYMIINFDGKKVGLKTGGHMSPLVAYNQENDSVLMMDVAGHKNGWYWVKINDLLRAVNSKDGNNYRGYLVIKNNVKLIKIK
ncbi:MAG: hypothetical protein ACI9IL_001150 [Rickettsiales bacterium]|jgi:hypothetical protein